MMDGILADPGPELYSGSSITTITVRTLTDRNPLEDQHSPL